MDIQYHVGFTALLAGLFFPIFGWKVIFLFVGGVLVDIDHYLWYVYKYRDWNPLRCHSTYMKHGAKNNYRDFDGSLQLFHTFEFIVLFAYASFLWQPVFIAFIGYLGHWLLDLIWLRFVVKRWVIEFSLLRWLWTSKNK